MMVKNKILYYICLFLVFLLVFNSASVSVCATIERGDIDENGTINAMDLVLMKRFFIENNTAYSYTVDVTMDNKNNIIDLVRIKKFLGGANRQVFRNELIDGLVWTVLQGDSSIGIIVPVGYQMHSIGRVSTDRLSNRYAFEADTFAYTIKNINPEFNSPSISIGITKINDINIEMYPPQSIIVDPDWIWAAKEANFRLDAPTNSSYETLVTVMLDGAIYPLKEITNTIIF